eukprot:scaffold3245_cov188-Prasinococcus_capsulatus_cf.AAC.1
MSAWTCARARARVPERRQEGPAARRGLRCVRPSPAPVHSFVHHDDAHCAGGEAPACGARHVAHVTRAEGRADGRWPG